MATAKQLKKAMKEISEALDKNDNQQENPDFTANFTLGWIRAIVNRSVEN